MRTRPRLARIIGVLDEAYPRRLAESWDSVGLVCGDPDDTVARALVCVDVTDRVADQAIADGAGLILAHHPLLLRGVDSVAADTPKGRIVHRLIRSGIGLFTAHTNADSARPGVSDALAAEFGLRHRAAAAAARAAHGQVGRHGAGGQQRSGERGDVRRGRRRDRRLPRLLVVGGGVGQFEPQAAANPTIGEIGRRERVDEARVEMVAERRLRATILAALRTAHPYEEPAFDVLELADLDSDLGLGRIGHLPQPMTAADFVALAQRKLNGPWGVRGTGDPAAMIATVAVCGGAGDSLLGAAAAAASTRT